MNRETAVSKLGAEIRAPRPGTASPLNLARAALRPPVASHPSRGRFAAPMHPTTRSVPAPRPRPYPWRPTLRGLDARQRCGPLHCQSGDPCSPDTPSVRLSRPTPRRKAFRLWTPDQPCAGWIRGNGVSRCIDIRGLSPKPRTRPSRPTRRSAGTAAGRGGEP
jgi:hypothetical protein